MKTHYELMVLGITLKKNELSVGPSACDITQKRLNCYYLHKKLTVFMQNFMYLTPVGEKSK